jgi:hypothetical protein
MYGFRSGHQLAVGFSAATAGLSDHAPKLQKHVGLELKL